MDIHSSWPREQDPGEWDIVGVCLQRVDGVTEGEMLNSVDMEAGERG